MKHTDHLQLFETIFQQSPISTQVFTPDGETVLVNAAWERLWNVTFAQVKRYNILQDKQLIETGIMAYIHSAFAGEIVTIPPIKYDATRTIDIKGMIPFRWLQAIMYPIRDNTGKISFLVLQHEDITEQTIAEEHLKESQERLKATWEYAGDAMALSDPSGTVIDANPAYFRLYGYTKEEVVGKSFAIIFPEHLRDWAIKEYRRTFRDIHHNTVIANIVVKDGTERIVESRFSPLIQHGEKIGMLSIVRDVTEQKKAQEQLYISEERLRLALTAGKIGVWDWDIVNNTITWSDRVYKFYEANPKTFDVTYENFQRQLHPDDALRAQEAIEQAVAGTVPYNITYRIVTLKGKVRWIASSATVTRDAKGNPLRMLGATIDVTEQKKGEQERSDFVSIATHELKTPVTSLKAYAEVLQRSFARKGDTHAATQLGKMNAQLDKLTNLISDLLDATKIEAGKLAIRKETFDVDDLIAEIVEELQRTTEKHHLVITRKIKTKITADRERIGQVLTNLLSNAIKYSPSDEDIRITASATGKQIQVSVIDVGVGITQSKQKHLFDRFYRISGPKRNTFPGLGLGLYISREIITRHGGEIVVESKKGKGAMFTFRLPIQ